MRFRVLTCVALAIVCAFSIAANASAETRYAAPTGSGSACEIATPCTLSTAINAASTGDEVIVTPGEYGSPGLPISGLTSSNITVRGNSPFEKPLIHTTGNNGLTLNTAPFVTDIRQRHYGPIAAAYAVNGVFTRTEMITSSAYMTCPAANDYVSAVCVNGAADGAAIGSYVGAGGTTALQQFNYRNVTAWSFGSSSSGFEASHTGGYRAQFNFFNSILRGTQDSLIATTDGVNSSTAAVVLKNVNYSSSFLTGAGSSLSNLTGSINQSAAPLLTDPNNGDVRPLAGSPTVNAGSNVDATGANEFGGGERIQGSAVDIGASEFPEPKAPSAPTPVVTNLKLAPRTFRIAKRGATFQAANKLPKKKRGQPSIGTLLSLDLNVASRIEISIERVQKGRRTGSKCGKPTRKNIKGKRCTYIKAIRGKQTLDDNLGANSFYFNGRWTPRIGAGSYRLTAKPVGGSSAAASFKIVR